MERNYPPGWNDPPSLGYIPAKPAGNVRNMLNKRIAFPVNSCIAGGSDNNIPNASHSFGDKQDKTCANDVKPDNHLDVSAYPNYPVNNGLHNPHISAVDGVDHFNRSASSPCFSQPYEFSAGAVPAVQYTSSTTAAPAYHHNQMYSMPAVPAVPTVLPLSNSAQQVEIPAPQYSNFEIINVLQGAVAGCVNFTKPTRDSIDRRIAALKIALESNSLSEKCRSRLCSLIYDLTNHRYNEAYSTHSIMMIEHYAEVNSWMVGVKAIIMEYLKH